MKKNEPKANGFLVDFSRKKLFLMLNWTFILTFLLCLRVSADSFSQNKRVDLDIREVSLKKAFSILEQKGDIRLLYSEDNLPENKSFTLNVNNTPVIEALQKLLLNTDLTFRVLENGLIVVTPLNIQMKDIVVRGKVTDAQGALPGVTIKLKGTAIGTTTDAQGMYSINVPENGTLVFGFLGYIEQEVAVNNRASINVTLLQSSEALSEVVVTALGITRDKKALSYAVTEIKGEQFTRAREGNIGASISGKIAGVNASGTASGLGGSTSVIIRGNGSLSGSNQPLYVVNGVPIDNTSSPSTGTTGGRDRGDGLLSINPDDIESISVLKGGTAAALYGSRAANGVILITTKSGTSQTGLGVELNSSSTLESPLAKPDWQYVYGSGSFGLKPVSQGDAVANGRTSWGAKLDGSPVIQFDGVSRPYSAQKDNVKNFYDIGTTFLNTVALNGGNETSNFRFSVSDMKYGNIVPNSTIKRNTFNLSANANLSKKIIFEGKAQYSIELNKNSSTVGAPWNNPNSAVTEAATSLDIRLLNPGYDANRGEVPWNDWIFSTNPYFAVNMVKNEDERRRLIGSFSTRYNITDFLYARARAGIDYYGASGFDLNPTGNLRNLLGEMSTSKRTKFERNVEALLGFNKTFGSFSVNALVGGNEMYTQNTGINGVSGLFNVPFQYFISNGLTQNHTPSFAESAINSVFGSADIGYKSFLYLSVTGRQDWFSTLSIKSNTLLYPSAGLTFILSDAWQSKPSWLSYAKIRTSWAQVGGGAPSPYGSDLTYTAGSFSHLGQPVMTISGAIIPNSFLKPYTSTTTEAGIEMRVFNNRIGADLTVYDKTTTNDIVSASVPLTSGYSSVRLNVGEIRNKGIEILLTGTPIQSPTGLNWNVSYNMAYNENTVVKIADGLTSLSGAKSDTQPGWVYNYEGKPFGMIAGFTAKTDANGKIVYNNATGLPLQSALSPLGRGVPPLTIGLSNSFKYKNFTLDFLLDSKFGSKIYSATNSYGTFFGLSKRTAENNVRETGVTVTGVDQNGAPFNKVIPAQNYYQGISLNLTDPFVYDSSFIKVRQFILGYSFPKTLLTKTPIQSASLSFVARNLWLLYSNVENVDPESSYNVSESSFGLESMGIPPTRAYGLSFIVRF